MFIILQVKEESGYPWYKWKIDIVMEEGFFFIAWKNCSPDSSIYLTYYSHLLG